MLVVLVAVVLAGLPEYAAAAAFGGLTAVHARYEPYPLRGRLLLGVGAGLTAAVALGAALSALHASAMMVAVAVAVVGAVAKLLSDAVALGPPGGLIFVFAVATAAAAPATWRDVAWQAAAAAVAATAAWAIAMAGWLLEPLGPVRLAVARALDAVAGGAGPQAATAAIETAWRALSTAPRSGRVALGVRVLEAELVRAESVLHAAQGVDRQALRRRARALRSPLLRTRTLTGDESAELDGRHEVDAQLAQAVRGLRQPWGSRIRDALRPSSPEFCRALRVLVGALSAVAAAHALQLGHAEWAAIAAAAVLQSTTVNHTAHRAMQRGIGTAVGAVLAAAVLEADLPLLAVLAVIVVAQFGAEVTVIRNYGLAMLFVTPLTLLVASLSVPADAATLGSDRILDTVLGAVIGVLAAIVVPDAAAPNRLRAAFLQARSSADALAAATDPAQIAARRAHAIASVLRLREAWDLTGGDLRRPEDADQVLELERECYRLIADRHAESQHGTRPEAEHAAAQPERSGPARVTVTASSTRRSRCIAAR